MLTENLTKTMPFWKWLKEHHAKYDLSTSNPPALRLEELEGIQLPKVDLGKSYFYGSPTLKKLLAGMYNVTEENVFIGSSASDINDTIFDCLIRKDDRILVESPAYPPLLESPKRRAELVGAEILTFKRKHEEGFKISIEEVSKLISKSTKLLIMTNLHNPSGVKTDEKTIKELTKLANDYDCLLMFDEVYRRYCQGLKSAYPLSKQALITDSMTKYYSAGSLRLGWAVGEKHVIQCLYALQGYRNVVNPSFSEDITTSLLPHQGLFDKRIKEHYDENFKIFEEWLKPRNDIEMVMPDGKFCCFPRLNRIKNTSKFVEHLYKKYNTLIVPGEFYGLPGHARICFGCDKEMLGEALKNIGKALNDSFR